MAERYEHESIEKKWQERWHNNEAFAAPEQPGDKKFYVLDMFPYPSGAGIHLGHTENYTATDIYSRFKRMQGYAVLHPIGWDAFGLPAENYAIKTGVPPRQTTDEAIANFRKQIRSLGFSYDWSREVGTHNPDYYRWTQWFFLFLYKNGLAEKRKAKVNWCSKDQTVLANEQVVDGACERCGTMVIQKDLEQWFFKITDFADALIDDLNTVDWPESTKINQRNWIGRSEGAELDFALTSGGTLTVFTTRPDTLFGATYMVIAPEHELAQVSADGAVRAYIEQAKNKTDLERQEQAKEKTGVELTGVKAINPATKQEIPIYVADYVLGGYGTGAIMAVPAHDERDYEFAKKFDLPVMQVVVPCAPDPSNPPKEGLDEVKRDTVIVHLRDTATGKYALLDWHGSLEGITTAIMGGVEEGQTPEEAAVAEIKEEAALDASIVQSVRWITAARYCASHKNQNRCAHTWGFLAEVDGVGKQGAISEKEKGLHTLVWVDKDEVESRLTPVHQKQVWHLLHHDEALSEPGYLINSGEFEGMDSEEAKQKITEAVGGRMMKTYRLRDWLISRQRYWGAPIPVVYDPEGKPHPVPEEHLPWLLPTDVEFKPTGISPLGQSKELLERTERIFGKGWRPEIDTMDTFVCSSWYYFRFADPHNEHKFAGEESIKMWLPVDLYMGGAEHTVLHLMYARFFTKALQREGLIDFSEPFIKLRHQGLIMAENGEKMSKSKGNVVNPDDLVAEYGADTLRTYMMFMGPLEAQKPWSSKNILGVRRFLERAWKLQAGEGVLSPQTEVLLNQTVKKVGDDIEALHLNTAISALMILLNKLEDEGAPAAAYKTFIQLLTPFAPHIAHELAERHGLDISQWPTYEEAKLTSTLVTVAVQINGKSRTTVDLAPDAPEVEAIAAAKAAAAKWIGDSELKKVIYVPGRVINVVV